MGTLLPCWTRTLPVITHLTTRDPEAKHLRMTPFFESTELFKRPIHRSPKPTNPSLLAIHSLPPVSRLPATFPRAAPAWPCVALRGGLLCFCLSSMGSHCMLSRYRQGLTNIKTITLSPHCFESPAPPAWIPRRTPDFLHVLRSCPPCTMLSSLKTLNPNTFLWFQRPGWLCPCRPLPPLPRCHALATLAFFLA